MVYIKMRNARVVNLEFTREEYGNVPKMRVEFDVLTPVGEFHYDSDVQSIDDIKRIMIGFGIPSISLALEESMPNVDLSIAFNTGGGTY